MFIQQKLSPAPPDPVQAKVMMALPIVFTFMFLWFPAGLVLYWVVNNMLSIAQQWVITKRVESGADSGKGNADKGGSKVATLVGKQVGKLVDLAKKSLAEQMAPNKRKRK